MSITQTTRIGVTRWSGGTDAFNRDQMDESHERIETRVGTFYSGTFAARPAASATYARGFYLATDQNSPVGILYYCDGSSWYALNAFASPAAQTPGDSITEGTATTSARSDHKHSLPSWGLVGEVANIGTAAAAGVTTKFARIDHVHVLADASVTAGKIAAGGVSATNQIASGIITATHFAAGSVGYAALAEDQRIPPGSMIMWTGTSTPVGWLICDGSSYATASYSNLVAAIGYKYGGAGANFNVPDMRDRLPRGATTPGTGATLGVQAGADTVTIATTNLPSHNHGASGLTSSGIGNHNHTWGNWSGYENQGHTHGIGTISADAVGNHTHGNLSGAYVVVSSGSVGFQLAAGSQTVLADGNTAPAGAHSHTMRGDTGGISVNHQHYTSGTTSDAGGWTPTISGNTANTGSGTALTITPKSLSVNFIIKI